MRGTWWRRRPGGALPRRLASKVGGANSFSQGALRSVALDHRQAPSSTQTRSFDQTAITINYQRAYWALLVTGRLWPALPNKFAASTRGACIKFPKSGNHNVVWFNLFELEHVERSQRCWGTHIKPFATGLLSLLEMWSKCWRGLDYLIGYWA